jgi:ankyrin repeat protein
MRYIIIAMSRFQSSFQPRPTPAYLQKIHYPEQQIDNTIINKLFVSVEEGNIQKIKAEILSNNSTVNIINPETGESLLHIVIKSSNISKDQKKEIIKFLLQNSAPVMAPDKNNVTPLHLACKYQLSDVISLLFEYGADASVYDNQLMTPLHYLAQGYSVQCKSTRVKVKSQQLDSLIDKPILEKANKLIDELTNQLMIHMAANPNINIYLLHIKNTLSLLNLNTIYYKDVQKEVKDVVDKFNNAIGDPSKSPEQVKSDLEKTSYDLKTSLERVILNKLNSCLSKTELKANTTDGWSPDGKDINKILSKKKDPKFIYDNRTKIKTNPVIQLRRTLGLVSDHVDSLYNLLRNINTEIGNIFWFNLGAAVNSAKPDDDANKDYLEWDEITKLLSDNRERKIPNLNIMENIDLIDIDKIPNIYIRPASSNPKIIREPVDTATDKDMLKIATRHPISIDLGKIADLKSTIGIKPKNIGIILKNSDLKYNEKVDYNKDYKINRSYQINLTYYSFSRIIYCFETIKNHMTQLKKNIENITNDYSHVYDELIAYSVAIIISINMNLMYINQELKKSDNDIANKIKELQQKFTEKYQINTIDHAFYLDHASYRCQKILVIMDNMSNKCKELYDNLQQLTSDFNLLIKDLNTNSGLNYIRSFHNNFADGYAANNNRDNIDNIYLSPIQDLKKSSEPWEVLANNIITPINIQYIKSLLFVHLPEITIYNKPVYVGKAPSVNAKIGYLSSVKDLNSLNFYQSLSYGSDNRKIEDLDSADKTRVGNIGIMATDVFNKNLEKSVSVPAIFGFEKLLDDHLNMIKYIILQLITAQVYEILKAGVQNTNFEKAIYAYNKYIRENSIHVDKDDNSLLYITVCGVVDGLINIYLKNWISNFAISATVEHLQDSSIIQFADDIKQKLGGDQVLLFGENKGFKLHLNELYTDILNGNLIAKLPGFKNIDMTGYIIENPEEAQNVSVLHNSSILVNAENSCFKIDSNIITSNIFDGKNYNINSKDKVGNSPIFYAIELQHPELIKGFINKGANVAVDGVRNLQNLTPYEFSKLILQTHLSLLSENNVYTATKPIYDSIKEKIKNNPIFKNNVLRYSDIAIPMLLYMINHYLYLVAKSYPKNLKYEELSNIIKDMNVDLNNYPLLEQTNLNKMELQENPEQTALQNKKISMLEEQIIEVQNTIDNMTKDPVHDPEVLLAKQNELASLNNDLNTMKQFKQTFIQTHNKNSIDIKTNIIKNISAKNFQNNIIKIYETIFWSSINNTSDGAKRYYSNKLDLKTYTELWNSFLKQNSHKTITNFHLCMNQYTTKLLTNINDLDVSKLNNIRSIEQKVFKSTAKLYEDLPLEYNQNNNHVMKTMLDIIIHVMKHTLVLGFYNTIIKTTLKYLKEMYPNESSDFLHNLLDQIISSGNTTESPLLRYIFGEMPTKLVKVTLQIFESEIDPDKKLTNDVIFNRVIELLQANKAIQIDNNTSLVKNIKTVLNPYFREYFELFIKELKSVVDNYMRYIITESKLVEIFAILQEQASKEQNKA